MIGQIQVTRDGRPEAASEAHPSRQGAHLAVADGFLPGLVRRGGGAGTSRCERSSRREGPERGAAAVVHLVVDTCDAMGRQPDQHRRRGRRAVHRGAHPAARSTSASSRTSPSDASGAPDAGSRCRVAASACRARRSRRGCCRPRASRASTRTGPRRTTRGIMNGIDAVAVATGQDWRSLEAGRTPSPVRHGRYERSRHGRSATGSHGPDRAAAGARHGRRCEPRSPRRAGGVEALRVGSARELAMVFPRSGSRRTSPQSGRSARSHPEGNMALHGRYAPAQRGPAPRLSCREPKRGLAVLRG